MRILTTLAMLLASFIPALGATTWPAGTNTVDQTFFGTNHFTKPTFATDLTLSGTLTASTQNLTTLNVSGTLTAASAVLNLSASTNLPGASVVGSVGSATNATTATNLVAPAIIVWSGPTNSLTLGYPWSKTTYVMTSDISVTNFLGIATGYPCESVFVLTNSAATSCAVRFPATAIGYGTLITNETAYVLAGKKAIVAVMSGHATNWAIVQQSQ